VRPLAAHAAQAAGAGPGRRRGDERHDRWDFGNIIRHEEQWHRNRERDRRGLDDGRGEERHCVVIGNVSHLAGDEIEHGRLLFVARTLSGSRVSCASVSASTSPVDAVAE